MFGSIVMTTERSFGLLLFGGVLVLTVSRNTGILGRLNWLSNGIGLRPRKGSTGDFIIRRGNRNFSDDRWKEFVSSQESEEADMRCELEVNNDLGEQVLFCWIMPSGKLRNFSPIHDGSIKDGSVSNCHVEYANTHHAFVCLKQSKRKPMTLSEVAEDVSHNAFNIKIYNFLFIYAPRY